MTIRLRFPNTPVFCEACSWAPFEASWKYLQRGHTTRKWKDKRRKYELAVVHKNKRVHLYTYLSS
jgi:hypothetical protein